MKKVLGKVGTRGEKTRKSQSESVDFGKIKPLKQEIKSLDLWHSMMLQWAYANFLLVRSAEDLEHNAESQVYDRGKQLIELKRQVAAVSVEVNARKKVKLLDDVLSLEYSALKSIENEVLLSAVYLKELEDNAASFLNRLDLDKGVVISPQDLAEYLENTAHTLRKISSLFEDETGEILKISEELQDFVEVSAEKARVLKEISELQREIKLINAKENIKVAEKTLPIREKVLEELVLEEIL